MKTDSFIIEVLGIDGSGKSAVVELLCAELKKRRFTVQALAPLSITSDFIKTVKELSKRVPESENEFHSFKEEFISTYYSYSMINKFLTEYNCNCNFVICDRYISSHLLNQYAFDVSISVLDVLGPLFATLPKASYTVLIDVPVDLALKRIQNPKPHENKTYLENSRTLHLKWAKDYNIPIIDGFLPIQTISEKILNGILP